MMKNIAILSVGILIGYLLLKREGVIAGTVIKPGDKSKDIEGMQRLFEKVAGIRYEAYGQYDADTLASIQYLMQGTSALKDFDKGYIKSDLVSDFSIMYNNSLKK